MTDQDPQTQPAQSDVDALNDLVDECFQEQVYSLVRPAVRPRHPNTAKNEQWFYDLVQSELWSEAFAQD